MPLNLLPPVMLPITNVHYSQTGTLIRSSEKFDEPVSSCVWAADCRSFITGSFDKDRALCQWNLDGERLFTWTKKHRTEDLAVSPDGQWLVAMDDQCRVHVYNFVTRELEYEMQLKARPTSVSISQDSRFLLVNQVDGEAQLVEIASKDVVQKYTGHTGGKFLIRSAFGGANESFAISGSEGMSRNLVLMRTILELTTKHSRWLHLYLAQDDGHPGAENLRPPT